MNLPRGLQGFFVKKNCGDINNQVHMHMEALIGIIAVTTVEIFFVNSEWEKLPKSRS